MTTSRARRSSRSCARRWYRRTRRDRRRGRRNAQPARGHRRRAGAARDPPGRRDRPHVHRGRARGFGPVRVSPRRALLPRLRARPRPLTWGFVDQPPFVPALAWLATHLLGTSPTTLRVLPALAGGASVVLTAAIARELGGRTRAQILAALAAATSPQVFGA